MLVDDGIERRADVATTTAAQDGPLGQFQWGDRLYNTPVMGMLGLTRFAVDYGRRETVLLSNGATASNRRRGKGAE